MGAHCHSWVNYRESKSKGRTRLVASRVRQNEITARVEKDSVSVDGREKGREWVGYEKINQVSTRGISTSEISAGRNRGRIICRGIIRFGTLATGIRYDITKMNQNPIWIKKLYEYTFIHLFG